MRRRTELFLVTGLLSSPIVGSAEPFRNLGFEDSPFGANAGISMSEPISQLVPFWTVQFNGVDATTGSLNFTLLAGYNATLYTSGTSPGRVLQGTKSFLTNSWFIGDQSASVIQQGDVPVASRSLRFLARSPSYPSNPLPPGPFF